MKINFSWPTWVKIGILVAVLITAPYFIPFALEFVIVADLMGLEALVVFLAASGKYWWRAISLRLSALAQNLAETAALVAELYLFKPRVVLLHATVSGLCLILASSVILCLAVWIPPMILSAQLVS
ncbi:hypothetical protein [Pseudohongiella sp.]|uniref:Uncharacterized protein n=1 Tax=marine sediment metagenome TaxID=412755 RepID=A0A0F9Z1H5_9ZZZZ|nr:hypothetical protein [Pseudohongiella sp.]HDZ08286.1 hypothetical protein [Pseudohongiella sp.]HEA62562.1 hypothetical protein [Pseudohongiella sp.]